MNVFVLGTGTIGGGRDRGQDRGRPNPRRNDGGPRAGTARGRGTRDGIASEGVVREIGTARGATEGSDPRGTRIARENGIPSPEGVSVSLNSFHDVS